ncbi:MAG: hypothetical protein RL732_1552 [Bacteroidota bacterium]|jgi:hypothetical protein
MLYWPLATDFFGALFQDYFSTSEPTKFQC